MVPTLPGNAVEQLATQVGKIGADIYGEGESAEAGDMNIFIDLVPIALMLGLTGLAAFLGSLRAGQYAGQYDDLEGAARPLSDDDLGR
jgi:cbb3-type cytochrome oxidase maturation protein